MVFFLNKIPFSENFSKNSCKKRSLKVFQTEYSEYNPSQREWISEIVFIIKSLFFFFFLAVLSKTRKPISIGFHNHNIIICKKIIKKKLIV